jgi:hypothetical protein
MEQALLRIGVDPSSDSVVSPHFLPLFYSGAGTVSATLEGVVNGRGDDALIFDDLDNGFPDLLDPFASRLPILEFLLREASEDELL